MGVWTGRPVPFIAAMPARSDAPPSPPSGDEPRSPRGRRRGLDGRAIAICVCIALLAAIGAGLLVSVLGGSDDSPTPKATLTPESNADRAKALTTKVTTFNDTATTVGAQLRGRPMVLNLWSTWCAPCLKEMPAIEKVHQANLGTVDFLGIDVKDQPDDAKAMILRTGVTYTSLQDRSGAFVTAADATALPVTMLVDANGNIVATHTGALTQAKLQDLIDTKLR